VKAALHLRVDGGEEQTCKCLVTEPSLSSITRHVGDASSRIIPLPMAMLSSACSRPCRLVAQRLLNLHGETEGRRLPGVTRVDVRVRALRVTPRTSQTGCSRCHLRSLHAASTPSSSIRRSLALPVAIHVQRRRAIAPSRAAVPHPLLCRSNFTGPCRRGLVRTLVAR
jgi:hypothetical protein